MTSDNDLQSAILEETMKEITKAGNADLVGEVLHNLGEIGAEGKMSKVFARDPERDDSYMNVYSTFDGTASYVPKVMVPKMLRKRVPRIPEAPQEKWGTLAFSLTEPKDVVARPTFMCDLHPQNAKREWLDTMGLAGRFCPKANLSSPYEVLRHRRMYHPDEDFMISDAEKKAIDEQTREYQRNIAEILASQARGRGRSAE